MKIKSEAKIYYAIGLNVLIIMYSESKKTKGEGNYYLALLNVPAL